MVVERGYYKHFKGSVVLVIDEAIHTETGEQLIVYRHENKNIVYVRPKRMFLENVIVDGKEVPRFTKI